MQLPPWVARRAYKGARRQVAPASGVINNIVVIVMENRTVDNLFAGYFNQPFGNTGKTWGQLVDIANPNGTPKLKSVGLESPGDPTHSHGTPANLGFALEYNDGAYGNWGEDCPGCSITDLSYVPINETSVYANLITKYAFAEEIEQANQGPSFVAHQYLIAAQSGGITETGSENPPYAEAENTNVGGEDDQLDPYDMKQPDGFCNNPSASVDDLNMSLDYVPALSGEAGNTPLIPCENYSTIFDLLNTKVVPPFYSWEYHFDDLTSYWAAPMAIQHFAGSNPNGRGRVPEAVLDPDGKLFVGEAQSSNLPALTYVIPCPYDSDHPGNGTDDGPLWVATMLNAIGGNTALWNQTAVFIVWDDWGGWYDHAPVKLSANNPYGTQFDANEWGFRVPLIVVSPYAKSGYISFTSASYSAILNFIEWNFGTPSLGGDDKAQPGTYDLQDAFNFSQPPTPYGTPIPVNGFKLTNQKQCPTM